MTANHLFRLTRTLVLVATVAALAVPAVALGGSNSDRPAQLSPVERIVLQENARQHDPAIYGGTWAVGYPEPTRAKQLSPPERIVLQEIARQHDPAIYGGTWVAGYPRPVAASAVEIVGPGGFHWTDAGLGAGATLAVVALAVGATMLARTGGLVKA